MPSLKELLKEKSKNFKEKLNDSGSNYENLAPDRCPPFSPGDKAKIRLLPPIEVVTGDSIDFWKVMYYHSYKKVSNPSFRNFFVCPKNNGWDEDCPFCDFAAEIYEKFGSNSDYSNYKRKRSYIFTGMLLDYSTSNKKIDKNLKAAWEERIGKVLYFPFPETVKKIIEEEFEETPEIFFPIDGYDLIIKVESKETDDGAKYNDYTLSKFNLKKPYSIIDNEDDLEDILLSINDYINQRLVTEKELEKFAIEEKIISDSNINDSDLDKEDDVNEQVDESNDSDDSDSSNNEDEISNKLKELFNEDDVPF